MSLSNGAGVLSLVKDNAALHEQLVAVTTGWVSPFGAPTERCFALGQGHQSRCVGGISLLRHGSTPFGGTGRLLLVMAWEIAGKVEEA
jgi:hypothetical protein